jgi:hypothetical protein
VRLALLLVMVVQAFGADPDDLRQAVRAGDAGRVHTLLKQGVPLNGADSLGGTALHDAVWAGEKEIVALLLDAGADVNARHVDAGSTPLHYAVITNHADIAAMLIAKGADVNARYRSGATPLHLRSQRESALYFGFIPCGTKNGHRNIFPLVPLQNLLARDHWDTEIQDYQGGFKNRVGEYCQRLFTIARYMQSHGHLRFRQYLSRQQSVPEAVLNKQNLHRLHTAPPACAD